MYQSDSEYMAGQLSAYGYTLADNPEEADLWADKYVRIPSHSFSHRVGCVPQGSRNVKELEGVSIVGVQQIDRVVEVVEETLKGHEVRLLTRRTLPALDLPKVRKNKFVEILPINVGCLGACTYCKTKHARGHLGSYTVDSLVQRRDIGVNLPILLNAIIAELPSTGSTMLRVGMTNPPYILEHLKEIAEVLCHPCVYSFLHVPVQSGSNAVLTAMNREYTVEEFRKVVDTLTELVPGMQIATDIICGFPGETDDDFSLRLLSLSRSTSLLRFIFHKFYPRPAEWKGRLRIWITDVAADGIHLVGHTKGYIQVLVNALENHLGASATIRITSVGRWSVFGEVIEVLSCSAQERTLNKNESSPNGFSTCGAVMNLVLALKSQIHAVGSENTAFQQPKLKDETKKARSSTVQFNFVDMSLIAGIFLSFLIAVASLSQLWFRKVTSS
ncbi:Threonylcarbamoyladenosine tRNA methylthiotransferase [Bienertia sinuspersici]